MNTVVKSESYRLWKSKEIKVMAAILIALQVLLVGVVIASRHIALLAPLQEAFGNGGGFFQGFSNVGGDLLFRILMVIMISSLVTKIYQSGVTKQLVSCGISRKNVVLGQYVAATKVFAVVTVVAAVAAGLGRLILGGGLGLQGVNIARLGLSFAGMMFVVASMVALYLLIVHATGSMGAAIALGLGIELAVPSGIMMLSSLLKMDFIYTYFISTAQQNAVNMSVTLGTQLIAIGTLAVWTIVLVALNVLVFKHKEVK